MVELLILYNNIYYMKHIKRFNEELSPETYMSAADKLRAKGHGKRADELSKHAEPKFELGEVKKEFTLYTSDGTSYNVKWENGNFVVIDSNRGVEIVDGLLYLNVPRMGNEKNPRLYTATRKEAIELNNLLKVIYPGHENVNINDVYRDIEVKPSYKETMKDKVATAKDKAEGKSLFKGRKPFSEIQQEVESELSSIKKPGLVQRFKNWMNDEEH